ncbi:MAG: hypothetical protein RLZZ444_1594 [Pseudomonadota bacterium]
MQTNAGGPIRHVVMWDVKGETHAEKAEVANRIKAEFESLKGAIPGMLELEIGIDISKISYACDVVLIADFETAEALGAYAVHEAHLAVRDRLEGLRVARHQVDYPPSPGERT